MSKRDEHKKEQHQEMFDSVFLAVKRGGYWFLANGYFWPVPHK